jgi:hypothetical protein
MRPTHWWVSLILLVPFLSTTIVSCRNPRTPLQAPPGVAAVASVSQIMKALTVPVSDVVFKSGAVVNSQNGLEITVLKNDKEWQTIENSAAILVESGNLLLIGNRVKDQHEWMTFTRAFMDASKSAMDAARDRNRDALQYSLDEIYLTCERCHVKYLK